MVLLQRTDIDIPNLGKLNAKQESVLRDLKNRKEICRSALFVLFFSFFPVSPKPFVYVLIYRSRTKEVPRTVLMVLFQYCLL